MTKPLPWRANWDMPDGTRVEVKNLGSFDELVVGELIHVEEMNDHNYFVSLGPLAFWIHRGRGGGSTITHAEIRGADDKDTREKKAQLQAMLDGRYDGDGIVTPKWKPMKAAKGTKR